VCGEEMTADVDTEKKWCKEKLKDVLRRYLAENIYNADDTAFFIKCYQTRQWSIEEKSVPVTKNIGKN
jgi:hypothetical protein